MGVFGRLFLCKFDKKPDFKLKRSFLYLVARSGELAVKRSKVGILDDDFYLSI